MDDPFIQRMKARNQARRNVLDLISEGSSNKENSLVLNKPLHKGSDILNNSDPKNKSFLSADSGQKNISLQSDKNEFDESGKTTHTSLSLSSTLYSLNKGSDSVMKVSSNSNNNNSKRSPRFEHLAQRSKQMQEWEDDYTYHSVSNSSVKEVECSDMGVHDAFKINPADALLGYDVPDASHEYKETNLKAKCLYSKSHFEEFQTSSKIELSSPGSSKNGKKYFSPQSQIDSSFQSLNSGSYSSPCPITNYILTATNDVKNTSPSAKMAISSSVSSPTKNLSWDKRLLKSLEAQGYTPSSSRSKLAYDFRDRSPIKEVAPSLPSNGKVNSNKNLENTPPKIISVQSKAKIPCINATNNSDKIKERERDLSPSKVSDLRNQWEQHIRDASPDRQAQRSPSPSPARKFADRSRSPVKSAVKIMRHSQVQSPKNTTYASKPKENSSVSRYQSSPFKPEPCDEVIKGEIRMPDAVPIVMNPSSSVKEKAAAFASLAGQRAPEKDPAELSVQDRLNLFEKKKGPALIPKAPFGQCISGKVSNSFTGKSTLSQSSKSDSNPSVFSTLQKDISTEEKTCSSSLVGTQKMVFERYEDNWRAADINIKIRSEKEKDLNMLQNRFRKAPPSYSQESQEPLTRIESSDSEYPESEESAAESDAVSSNSSTAPIGPPKPPRTGHYPETSPKDFARPLLPGSSCSPSKIFNSTVLDASNARSPRKDYEPKVKPGCVFPSLSDIESHSEAVDSDEECRNSSFAESVLTCASGESLGTKIQKMAQGESMKLNVTRQLSVITESVEGKHSSSICSADSNTLEDLDAVDDAIDEALNEGNESGSSKRGRNTREDDEGQNSAYKTQKLCRNSENVHESSENTLAHTISMYRKQKPSEVIVTPVRQIVRKSDDAASPVDSPISPSVTISARIRALQEDEEHQLTVISQASNAINVVSQHPEQHGTTQHIEAEKLLLVATQKRQCALHEIQRLKAEGALGKRNFWNLDEDCSRGSVSISNVSLPFKSDFLNKLNEKNVHHFVMLVKHRDQVIISQLQSTPDCIPIGGINFTNLMVLHNLTADFNISLEVYGFKVEPFQAAIKKDHSRLKLTPLKRIQKESKPYSPVLSSPGGPYSIRSSSFTLIGFANININTLTKNAWTLEKVPFSSPVNGHLLMDVSVTMEGGAKESSFLNMFEDIGGFGAWNRRWCILTGSLLRYWKYPDDISTKECIGFHDLRTCTTRKVELVSRDICARQHTFQLTFMRPLQPGDKADLVHDIKNNTLISRILLSADSKDERISWCNKLNKALANVRSWDPDALKPEDFHV